VSIPSNPGANDGGTAYVKTRVAAGDELVEGFVASGASLVTRGSSSGNLFVHRLDEGTTEESGTDPSVEFASHADVLLTCSSIWTPDLGFISIGLNPFMSPDGSLYATFDSEIIESDTSISVFSTHPKSNSQGPIAIIPAGSDYLGAEFSPDGRFLFVSNGMATDPHSSRVRRISMNTSSGAVNTAVVPNLPLNFDSLGDAISVGLRDGVFRWPEGDAQPERVASFEPGDLAISGDLSIVVGGDSVYVDAGGDPPTHTDTISLLSGQRLPVTEDGPGSYLATSPNGVFALVLAADGAHVIRTDTNRITASLFPCPSPESEHDVAWDLAFTPDSAHVIGGWYSCTVAGHPFPTADVVSVDVYSGEVVTLAERGYGRRPYYVEGGRVVFVRPPPPAPYPNDAKGDLMLAYIDGRAPELLVTGVDDQIAVNDRTIAYSVHGDADTTGVYTVTLP
jgi:hypothetical protein